MDDKNRADSWWQTNQVMPSGLFVPPKQERFDWDLLLYIGLAMTFGAIWGMWVVLSALPELN